MQLKMSAIMEPREDHVDITIYPIYHEKQSFGFCALHALNNLFQDESAYSRNSLDEICKALSPGSLLNPHKSLFGIGIYDVNVVFAALQGKDYEALWYDKRRDPSTLELSNIFGFILNILSPLTMWNISLGVNRRHWIAVREIRGKYYNLDSKLNAPWCIGEVEELLDFLRESLKDESKQIFVIVKKSVARDRLWQKKASPVCD